MLTPVRVTSEGSFEFNREKRKASFDQDVVVVQRTSREDEAPQHNTLNCERLELLFDEAAASSCDQRLRATNAIASRNCGTRRSVRWQA